MSAIDDIAAERRRQIEIEGWTREHDDKHDFGEIARAAACYAMTPACRKLLLPYTDTILERIWPWSPEWWKPKDRRRDLVRAGALIVAEIERRDRAEANKTDRKLESFPKSAGLFLENGERDGT